ncbi:hypothetical protein EON65_15460 [archaeon]|nr:MAG: hypothetical protein EON65_15460 [archaeon]
MIEYTLCFHTGERAAGNCAHMRIDHPIQPSFKPTSFHTLEQLNQMVPNGIGPGRAACQASDSIHPTSALDLGPRIWQDKFKSRPNQANCSRRYRTNC